MAVFDVNLWYTQFALQYQYIDTLEQQDHYSIGKCSWEEKLDGRLEMQMMRNMDITLKLTMALSARILSMSASSMTALTKNLARDM
jgi:hypothetical protein